MLGLGDYESSGDEDTPKTEDKSKNIGKLAHSGSNNVSCTISNHVLQQACMLMSMAFSRILVQNPKVMEETAAAMRTIHRKNQILQPIFLHQTHS